MAVMALDVGTTGIKSVMYGVDGSFLGSVTKTYNILNPKPGYYELSPADISEAAMGSVEELIKITNVHRVDIITAASFGESIVFLDENDKPILNVILYMDDRGSDECVEFESICNRHNSFSVTGESPHPMLSMYKLKFLKRNGLLDKICKIYFIADYVLHLFGGEHYTDYTLAARSGMMDISQNKWWEAGLAYLGISENCFPRIVQSGSKTGTMSLALRNKLGILNEVDIIIGGHDQIMASVGAGIFKAGLIMNGLGSVDNMTVTFKKEQKTEHFLELNYCIMPYVVPDIFASYLYNFSGGNLIRWFSKEFMKEVSCKPENKNVQSYKEMDSLIPSEPTNILVTPHFSGTGTPKLNLAAKGMIAGLTFETTREELYRAILEGEALDMKMNLVCLEEIGIVPNIIITVGGGSNSDSWMQIRADVFDKEIHVYDNHESGTIGCAILALVKSGFFKNYEEAHASILSGCRIFYPNPKHSKIYNEKFYSYKNLFEASMQLYN